jgi:hypothetical protein
MIIKLYEIWMAINLKVEKHIYNFFSIYLAINYQGYQNKPLWTDPFSLVKY